MLTSGYCEHDLQTYLTKKKKILELKAKSHTHQNNAILGRHVDINYILVETQLLFGTAYASEVTPPGLQFPASGQ